MNVLQTILQSVMHLFRWWFVVLPWEQGIRVRLGNRVRVYAAGFHFMVPFVDRTYVQNTRQRTSPSPSQTLTTSDGRTLTICGSLRYRIDSALQLHQTLHQAEETLGQQVAGLISDFVRAHPLAECTPAGIADAVTDNIKLERFGLWDGEFVLTDFAIVRSYRLIDGGIGNSRWTSDRLDTSTPSAQAVTPR